VTKRAFILLLCFLVVSFARIIVLTEATAPSIWVDKNKNYTFDSGVDTPCPTIQDAVNTADIYDWICVDEGKYKENVVVNKTGLYLVAVKGPELTEVGVEDVNKPVFNITASDVIVEGFKLVNATGNYPATGIYMKNIDNCTIRANIIEGDRSGIWGKSITNCLIEENEICNIVYLHGIYLADPVNCQILNNNITKIPDTGIALCRPYHTLVKGNEVKFYVYNGIKIYNSPMYNCTIEDNLIDGGYYSSGQIGVQVHMCGDSFITIRNNTIIDNEYGGIAIFSSNYITIMGNSIENSQRYYGVAIHESGHVCVIGNLMTGNSKGIWLTHSSEDIVTVYNDIVDNTEYGAFADDQSNLDARLNWWGDPTGPSGVGPGNGDPVSSNVIYEPWLTAPITSEPDAVGLVAYNKSAQDEVLTFPNMNMEISLIGSANVFIALYKSNPGTDLEGDIGIYIDIYIPDASQLTQISVKIYYDETRIQFLGLRESSLTMHWWDGSEWRICSDAGVNTDENYVWAVIGWNTKPSLTDLSGTAFGCGKKPPPVGGTVTVGTFYTLLPWISLATLTIATIYLLWKRS